MYFLSALGHLSHEEIDLTLTCYGRHYTVAHEPSFPSSESSAQRALRDSFSNGEWQIEPCSQQMYYHFIWDIFIVYVNF